MTQLHMGLGQPVQCREESDVPAGKCAQGIDGRLQRAHPLGGIVDHLSGREMEVSGIRIALVVLAEESLLILLQALLSLAFLALKVKCPYHVTQADVGDIESREDVIEADGEVTDGQDLLPQIPFFLVFLRAEGVE